MAKNFLGALRAQSEGQGNLSMHPQGDNLYGYGPTTHFLAYFRLVLGATNTPPAPRFRPVLGLAAPAAPFGSFGTFRDLGSPEPQNMHVHVLGFLADRPPRQPTFRPRAPLGCCVTYSTSFESSRRDLHNEAKTEHDGSTARLSCRRGRCSAAARSTSAPWAERSAA